MPSIPVEIRVLFWIAAAMASGLSALIGNVLAINIVHFFSRQGRPPTPRPTHIWIMFYVGLALSIGFGALAAFAPASSSETGNSPVAAGTPAYSSNDLRLVPTDGQNIVVKRGSRILSLNGVIPLNETVTVHFTILNNGPSLVTIKGLVIGARGPGVTCENKNVEKWSAPDNPFPTDVNIAIQPGKSHEYQRNLGVFYVPGRYFFEPIIQGPGGAWGGIQPFSCIDITVR